MIGETDLWNAPSALYFYDASGTPISMYYNSTRYYYATNLQGDVIALYAEGGTKICDYYYSAYGACTISYSSSATTAQRTAAAANPLRYRGYYYDTETGLYYLGSRSGFFWGKCLTGRRGRAILVSGPTGKQGCCTPRRDCAGAAAETGLCPNPYT